MGWGVYDYPQPEIDDELLEEGEYRAACEQAAEETAELVATEAARLQAEQPDLLADAIDSLDADQLQALATLINASQDAAFIAWRASRFADLARDEVRPVSEEDVLRRWHP